MATHSSSLAWEIPWAKESGGLQSMGSQRVGPNEHARIYSFSVESTMKQSVSLSICRLAPRVIPYLDNYK